jgi:hypothetical protein
MRKNHVASVLAVVLIGIMFVSVTPSLAGDAPADNMEILREKVRADKKLVIAEAMQLTRSEAKVFWPVYEDYLKEIKKLGDRTLSVIEEYAKNYKYETLTDVGASKMLDDYLTLQADRLKLMESFLPKFKKALSPKKVVRYYQLENKINASIAYGLAAQIPLVK